MGHVMHNTYMFRYSQLKTHDWGRRDGAAVGCTLAEALSSVLSPCMVASKSLFQGSDTSFWHLPALSMCTEHIMHVCRFRKKTYILRNWLKISNITENICISAFNKHNTYVSQVWILSLKCRPRCMWISKCGNSNLVALRSCLHISWIWGELLETMSSIIII